MKTKHLLFGLSVILLTLCACREITVRTTVHEDGSFTRTVTITGDSAEVYRDNLPYPVDTSWSMKVSKDTVDTAKYVLTYTKHFRDAAELDHEIKTDTGWMKELSRRIEIRKHFAFFYSRLVYKEVYSASNPFTMLAWKDHISDEDYIWVTRQKAVQNPSDSVREKRAEDTVINYLMESAAAEVEKILSDGISRLKDPGLDPTQVHLYSDSIKNVLTRWDMKDPQGLIDYYAKWTGNPAVLRLKELQPAIFEEFGKKARFLDQLFSMEEFHIEVTLPGMITQTNSNTLKGNTVRWDVHLMSFLLEDQVMTAESKVMNTWAYILAGFIILGLIIVLVIRTRKNQV
jgi:hypothetical protein